MKTTTYYKDGNPNLHNPIRMYFDSSCKEFRAQTIEEKLMDLAVAFDADIDLKSAALEMLANNPDIDEQKVRCQILEYIEFLRSGELNGVTRQTFEDEKSIAPNKVLLNLLRQEISIRFNEGYAIWSNNEKKTKWFHWTFAECFKTIHWDYNRVLNGITRKGLARKILLQPTQIRSNQMLLLLGTGAYNIYQTKKNTIDRLYEVAGTGVKCVTGEITQMFGDENPDPDLSMQYLKDEWKYILCEYKKYGATELTIMTCMNGNSAQNLCDVLIAAKELKMKTSVSLVMPFEFEGTAKLERSEKIVRFLVDEDLVMDKFSVVHNQQMMDLYEKSALCDAFRKFNMQICDVLLFDKNCRCVK